jgi:hypothetical protein
MDRTGIEPPTLDHVTGESCANCGTIRAGPYCHECGQSGHIHRHAGALAHDIAHGVFHFEGKIWRTLPLLAWWPGELTRRYVMGERAKFVSPIVLFLFSVFLMFAVLAKLSGETPLVSPAGRADIAQQLGIIEDRIRKLKLERPRATNTAAREATDDRIRQLRIEARALAVIGRQAATPSPGGASGALGPELQLGWPWFDEAVSHAAENPDLTFYKLKTYAYKYSWALIPISIPFIWLLFTTRRDVGLYDHAIFATYSLSFMSLACIAIVVLDTLGMPSILTVLAVLIVPPLHIYRQLKGAYQLSRAGAAWRTAVLAPITAVALILFLAFLIYIGLE